MRRWPDASEYHPEPAAIEAAEDRTRDIVKAWAMRISSLSAVDLGTLARSCYLQGVWDAGQALAITGQIVLPRKTAVDSITPEGAD